ncbi:MAG TPA: hypothetical protein VGK19_07110 [Capsulimonadaceae bacterium]
MTTTTNRKKPGPTPGPATVKATVLLEPDLVDWGKAQPGGLSSVVRKLLREAQAAPETQRRTVRGYGILAGRALTSDDVIAAKQEDKRLEERRWSTK